MIDEKICPFMSRPVSVVLHKESGIVREIFVPCQREKCMAWGCLIESLTLVGDSELCDKCDIDRPNPNCRKLKDCAVYEKPYCRLIERGD